jgi:hypothetical protein
MKDVPTKLTFRKRRNDMVLRQLKLVHESSLIEERRFKNTDNEVNREICNNDRVDSLGIG